MAIPMRSEKRPRKSRRSAWAATIQLMLGMKSIGGTGEIVKHRGRAMRYAGEMGALREPARKFAADRALRVIQDHQKVQQHHFPPPNNFRREQVRA